jgi:hypothetical protein
VQLQEEKKIEGNAVFPQSPISQSGHGIYKEFVVSASKIVRKAE